MRYNRKFIEARFAMAMDAMGVPHGPMWSDGKAQVGTYGIDYNSVYGGYCIRRIANEGGGESLPFGMSRHNAAAFVAQLDGIINAANIIKRGA